MAKIIFAYGILWISIFCTMHAAKRASWKDWKQLLGNAGWAIVVTIVSSIAALIIVELF